MGLLHFISNKSQGQITIRMAAPSNYINKNREDILDFLKKAVSDRSSNEYHELTSNLIKMFVDSDVNKDGTVNQAGFSFLIDNAAFTPRMFGFAPEDSEMYPTPDAKDRGRLKLFQSIDLGRTGRISLHEWIKFAIQHIAKKVATVEAHPKLETPLKAEFQAYIKKAMTAGSAENLELYWYLLQLFLNHCGKNGLADKTAFGLLLQTASAAPLRHGLLKAVPSVDDFDQFEDGVMTWDQFLAYATSQIYKKC